MTIDWFDTERIFSAIQGSGTCYGDSGGPGLAGDEVDAVIVGINSSHSRGGVPGVECYVTRMRTDAYHSWIADTLEQPVPTCQDDPSLCPCSSGCRLDGTCDVHLCETRLCGEILECGHGCDGEECLVTCYVTGTPEAKELYRNCSSAPRISVLDEALWSCASERCADSLAMCLNDAWSVVSDVYGASHARRGGNDIYGGAWPGEPQQGSDTEPNRPRTDEDGADLPGNSIGEFDGKTPNPPTEPTEFDDDSSAGCAVAGTVAPGLTARAWTLLRLSS